MHAPVIAAALALIGGAPANLHDGLAVAAPTAALADPGRMAGLPAAIARGDFPKTSAVLIVVRGRLAYEGYFGDGNRDLLNDTRSAMKSVTGLAVGLAIADHAIPSVKAPALAYLSELTPFANSGPEKRAITLEDLLTMSSALDCNDDDDASPGNEDRMHERGAWTRWAVDLPIMNGWRRDAAGLGPWRYCTAGAVLAGQIVQRATRTRIDHYIEARTFAPLGIRHWQWPYSPTGEVMTGGGLRLTARDMAKVASMLADDGRWHGRQVIPAAWVNESLTARRPAYPGLSYGYFFWNHVYQTPCGPVDGWYMAGNGGNAILVLKDLKAAVVVARTNFGQRAMHKQTTQLLETYVLPAIKCPAVSAPS